MSSPELNSCDQRVDNDAAGSDEVSRQQSIENTTEFITITTRRIIFKFNY